MLVGEGNVKGEEWEVKRGGQKIVFLIEKGFK
jgi:hypothetical protein